MLFPEGSQSSLRGIYVYDKNREAGQEVYKDIIKCKPMKFTVRILRRQFFRTLSGRGTFSV